jgi:maltose alpha-D-glucosyltransferase/alpha-amylase
LRAYHQAAQGPDFLPPRNADFGKLLNVFLLDKALYEVLYELNSRPAWVRIPLMGIMLLVP